MTRIHPLDFIKTHTDYQSNLFWIEQYLYVEIHNRFPVDLTMVMSRAAERKGYKLDYNYSKACSVMLGEFNSMDDKEFFENMSEDDKISS